MNTIETISIVTVSGMNIALQGFALGFKFDRLMDWDFIANSDMQGRGNFADLEAGLIELYYSNGTLHSRWQISFETLMGVSGNWFFKEVRN